MNAREQGFLLLTSHLGDPERPVLTAAQLRTLTQRVRASERDGSQGELREQDLRRMGYSAQMADKICRLLDAEAQLDYYLRKGRRSGCTPVSRVSAAYPPLLRKRLGEESPGCLWARGDLSLLQIPAISLVGSRDLREKNRQFARMVGHQAALQGFALVSGNARGADREAQEACLEAGGKVISVVADSLEDHAPRENMLYLAEDSFDFGFSTPRALSRNWVIHALGWRALVAQVSARSGGTWSGSVQNLRHGFSPLFCFEDGSEGAHLLLQMGAEPVTMEMLSDFQSLKTENLFA